MKNYVIFVKMNILKNMEMKKIILLAGAVTAVLSCGTQKKNSVSVIPGPEVESAAVSAADVADKAEVAPSPGPGKVIRRDYGGHEGFALKLLSKANLNPDENVTVSPFSAGMALSMLKEGAEGETRLELAEAMNLVPFSEGPAYGVPEYDGRGQDLHQAERAERLAQAKEHNRESEVELRIANSVWADDGIAVRPEFRGLLEKSYDAQFFTKDFASRGTVDEINAWCSEKTAGKIPSIVDNISPDQKMFLLNALYFKAPWKDRFAQSATVKDTFHGLKGDTSVDFMHITKNFGYCEEGGCKVVVLPYRGDAYAMVVALPADGMDVNTMLDYVDFRMFRKVMSLVRNDMDVELSLPKFKVEADMVLNDVLKTMGVKKAFTANAEFNGMTDARVAVDEVRQKCYVAVDEQGSEAAAVTSIGIKLTSMPMHRDRVEMVVDRPFLFAILNLATNEILFEGKIANIDE